MHKFASSVVLLLLCCGHWQTTCGQEPTPENPPPAADAVPDEADQEMDFQLPKFENSDNLSPVETKRRLESLIRAMDTDQSNSVSTEELKSYIQQAQRRHYHEQVDERWSRMKLQVKDVLPWSAYRKYAFGESAEGTESEAKKLLLAQEEKRFRKADADDDGALSKKEFFDFLHPELNPRMHDVMVEDTLMDMDLNRDGVIDEKEFLATGSGPSSEQEETPWLEHARTEFATVRDKNKDGKLDREEMVKWLAPPLEDQAEEETRHLMEAADKNKDGVLSKKEILENYLVFIGSQVTNYGTGFYDIPKHSASHDEL